MISCFIMRQLGRIIDTDQYQASKQRLTCRIPYTSKHPIIPEAHHNKCHESFDLIRSINPLNTILSVVLFFKSMLARRQQQQPDTSDDICGIMISSEHIKLMIIAFPSCTQIASLTNVYYKRVRLYHLRVFKYKK